MDAQYTVERLAYKNAYEFYKKALEVCEADERKLIATKELRVKKLRGGSKTTVDRASSRYNKSQEALKHAKEALESTKTALDEIDEKVAQQSQSGNSTPHAESRSSEIQVNETAAALVSRELDMEKGQTVEVLGEGLSTGKDSDTPALVGGPADLGKGQTVDVLDEALSAEKASELPASVGGLSDMGKGQTGEDSHTSASVGGPSDMEKGHLVNVLSEGPSTRKDTETPASVGGELDMEKVLGEDLSAGKDSDTPASVGEPSDMEKGRTVAAVSEGLSTEKPSELPAPVGGPLDMGMGKGQRVEVSGEGLSTGKDSDTPASVGEPSNLVERTAIVEDEALGGGGELMAEAIDGEGQKTTPRKSVEGTTENETGMGNVDAGVRMECTPTGEQKQQWMAMLAKMVQGDGSNSESTTNPDLDGSLNPGKLNQLFQQLAQWGSPNLRLATPEDFNSIFGLPSTSKGEGSSDNNTPPTNSNTIPAIALQKKKVKLTKAIRKADERLRIKKEKLEEKQRLATLIETRRNLKRKRHTSTSDTTASIGIEDGLDSQSNSGHEEAGERPDKKAKEDVDEGPSKKTSVSIVELYLATSPSHQAELRAEARVHVKNFLKDNNNAIPFRFRRLIREVQTFLPEAAVKNRTLALHCFETRPGNLICPYHGEKDKNGAVWDGAVDGKFKVTGTPYQRLVRGRLDEAVPERMPDHLHCGCPEDEVLMDFIWWKTSVCASTSSKVEEGFGDQRMDPRTRMFMYAIWSDATAQTVDAMYMGKRSVKSFKITSLKRRIEALQEALEDERRAQAEEAEENREA